MSKILQKYKQIPSLEDFTEFKWYVLFVHPVKNIFSIEQLCNSLHILHRIWAPCYQECYRRATDLVLVDRLLYRNYVFIGLKNVLDFDILVEELTNTKKGILLGSYKSFISKEEFLQVRNNAINYSTINPFSVPFDLKKGDHVVVVSGPCSGLFGVVEGIQKNGRAVLNVFFLNREISITIPILDIQPLKGDRNGYNR